MRPSLKLHSLQIRWRQFDIPRQRYSGRSSQMHSARPNAQRTLLETDRRTSIGRSQISWMRGARSAATQFALLKLRRSMKDHPCRSPAFSQRPLPRAYRPFMETIFKVAQGRTGAFAARALEVGFAVGTGRPAVPGNRKVSPVSWRRVDTEQSCAWPTSPRFPSGFWLFIGRAKVKAAAIMEPMRISVLGLP